MKKTTRETMRVTLLGLFAAAGLMFSAAPAFAGVNWSVNVGVPAYYPPPPVYLAPPPVYYAPPPPVYVRPAPVVVYGAPGYYPPGYYGYGRPAYWRGRGWHDHWHDRGGWRR
ncbi:hypothetical protein BCF11_0923 [Collimonas sp. PA-H2]|uniref:hypothetical protein n=1 Tax=Collimonas sp. PA-H2 TaxID=1881062 RepID=UPI000C008720|nr:hypothetical protein BCF11_0923 [Collimonas sp. PA-H2]